MHVFQCSVNISVENLMSNIDMTTVLQCFSLWFCLHDWMRIFDTNKFVKEKYQKENKSSSLDPRQSPSPFLPPLFLLLPCFFTPLSLSLTHVYLCFWVLSFLFLASFSFNQTENQMSFAIPKANASFSLSLTEAVLVGVNTHNPK